MERGTIEIHLKELPEKTDLSKNNSAREQNRSVHN
jgi:hypothetical protein